VGDFSGCKGLWLRGRVLVMAPQSIELQRAEQHMKSDTQLLPSGTASASFIGDWKPVKFAWR
jgi:hypothetical protein